MTERLRVMVVDDDPAMCELLRQFLERRGYAADVSHTAEEAVRRFEAEPPAAVILDLVMPGPFDGLGALAAFRRLDRTVPVVVVSGLGHTATIVQAMKLGATDFVGKPFEEADLEAPLLGALRQQRLCREVAQLRQQLQGEARQTLLYGQSERMVHLRELIDRVADTDVPVLIRGECGTGKELVARALYAKSRRCERQFVKVNCAALPPELLEPELFGVERGAFTGAFQHKPGKLEFANRGTLFLDELGALPLPLQAKLLQVLQDGEFSRLGGTTDVPVDVRVLAATSQDLEAAAAAGRFRQDLFLRLNVVTVDLPPLRDRREEIPALTDFFLKKHAVQYNKPLVEISPHAMEALVQYDWPGNVRELENIAKRAVVLGSESAVLKGLQLAIAAARHRPAVPAPVVSEVPAAPAADRAPAAPVPVGPPAPGQCSLKDVSRHAAREAERELILRMLQHTRWNRKEAAAILGISYKALLYKIKEGGLDRAS